MRRNRRIGIAGACILAENTENRAADDQRSGDPRDAGGEQPAMMDGFDVERIGDERFVSLLMNGRAFVPRVAPAADRMLPRALVQIPDPLVFISASPPLSLRVGRIGPSRLFRFGHENAGIKPISQPQ